jgi:hypothetical protein
MQRFWNLLTKYMRLEIAVGIAITLVMLIVVGMQGR